MTRPTCALLEPLSPREPPAEFIARVRACPECGGEATCLAARAQPVPDAAAKLQLLARGLTRAQQGAAELGATKAQFLANMSHEIRTPMNAVIGMSELLLDTALSARQQEFAETIRTSAALLMALVDDVLDFSQIEGDELELTHASFALDEVLEGAFSVVREAAASKGLDLAFELRPGTPTHFVGDLQRLQQVLTKLLSNAVKFTQRGEVLLSVELGEPVEVGELGELRFCVRDSGIGIARERIEQLFAAFTQADPSPTRSYGGAGLGLSIAKRLVELMDGTLSVESELGVGSVFRFSVRVQVASAPERERDVEALRERPVLIVDDSETNREILLRVTESWGMRPRCVPSGAEALELLTSEEPFALALFDDHMPGMDGVLLARTVRRLAGREQLPIVLLTSGGGRLEREHELFAAVMQRPVHPRQLRELVLDRLAREGTQGQQAESSQTNGRLGCVHPLRILVAEDNSTNRRVLELLLERHGYEPDMVHDGHAAVEMALVKRYDLILMDVKMPKLDGLKAMRAINHALTKIRRPRMIAMTAGTGAAERDACLAAGADEFLAKPIDKRRLLAALERCVALSPSTRGSNAGEGMHDDALASTDPLSILIAEDNAVNQKVISMLLERLGHRCLIVSNGREAVEQVAKQRFDLVLMDCHMPVLDGYAATRELRALPGGDTLPIVALTALNRPSDRERCLEVGMDGYVAKPIDTSLLVAQIARARAVRWPAGPEAWSQEMLAQLRELAQLQPEFLDEVLELYHRDTGRLLAQLRAALEGRELEAVGATSHELMGASRSVGAQRVAARAQLLCELAEAGRYEDTPAQLEALSAEIEHSLAGFSEAVARA